MIIANPTLSQFTVKLGLSLLCLSPLVSPIAQAKPHKDPVPEQRRRPPATNGRSAGSRGCAFAAASAQSQPFRLMVAPSGQTDLITEHPTFGWTLGNRLPVAVVFRIYALGADQSLPQILVEEQLQDIPVQAELLSYTVQQPLADGTYLWQVELVCDRDRPSGNIALEGQFQKIAPPAALSRTLAIVSTADQVSMLRTAGYWYDLYSHTLNQPRLTALGGGFSYCPLIVNRAGDHPQCMQRISTIPKAP